MISGKATVHKKISKLQSHFNQPTLCWDFWGCTAKFEIWRLPNFISQIRTICRCTLPIMSQVSNAHGSSADFDRTIDRSLLLCGSADCDRTIDRSLCLCKFLLSRKAIRSSHASLGTSLGGFAHVQYVITGHRVSILWEASIFHLRLAMVVMLSFVVCLGCC